MSARKCTPIPSSLAALSRAKLARLIAAAFSEPRPDQAERLRHPTVQEEIREAARNLGIPSDNVAVFFAAMNGNTGFEEEYIRLLGHTVRSECPPYELEYRTAEVFQQSQTLADIMGFYRAFGFDVNGPVPERADHVATQWEFLAALSMMEAVAQNTDKALTCIDAQRSFLREHAASWMPAFFERIRRAGPDSGMAHAALLGRALLENWCRVLDLEIGPRWLELREVTEEDSTITCGAPGTVELGPGLAAAMEARN